MDPLLAGREYASHLTDADLGLLASLAAGTGQRDGAGGQVADGSSLRGDPAALLRLLEHPGVFRAVTGQGEAAPGWASASPFLVFAAFVQRATGELASMDHVPERTGLRQRVPLFDAPALRDFLAAPARRLFLAELLASFTRVASGRYRSRVGGRTRTRRFSELDPVRLAGMLDMVPQAERPGVYRRLGDVALFLTGVFSRLRDRPRVRSGQCRAAAARRRPARLAAGAPGRHASHRAVGAPGCPLVPDRP